MRLAVYQPDIPQNLGAMIRLGACFGVPLDVIEPCGFPFSVRALIARALATGPELLILDEPSAGLDLAGREALLQTIASLLNPSLDSAPPPALLQITHHPEELSPDTTQVMLMRGGRITHAGEPDEILTDAMLSVTMGCKVNVRRIEGRWWVRTR